LRAVRSYFDDAHITGILRPYVAGVLEGTNWLDTRLLCEKKHGWSRSWYSVAWQLHQRKPDLAILLNNTFRSGLIAWLAGCRRRIGYRRYGRGLLLTDRVEPVRDAYCRLQPGPVIDTYNLLAKTAGCPDPGHGMELHTTPEDEKRADAVWDQERLANYPEVICLNPGAAFGAAKHWPTEYFALLAKSLVDERGSGVLVLCGPGERDLARNIVRLTGRESVHSLADVPLSLGLTKACVRRSDLLITTDSGPRHFAAAFDRPVVSLFGPTHIAWTITYYAREICLQKKVPCGPCQQRVCPLDHRCMNELLPQEVYVAAVSLLSQYPPRRHEMTRKAS
jgi:heptosyltransferase-2